MSKKSKGQALVGRAFRFEYDGIVRYVTGVSQRNYLHMLWLDEAESVWYTGYPIHVDKWIGGIEVEPPKGKSLVCGATGIVSEMDIQVWRR